jgi:uncharacterized protein YdhG (YjbR/CyaY superfamily)
MKSDASTVSEYLANLPEDRKEAVLKLRQIVLDNLPDGFEETMNYGMIAYVVPHSIYPPGYHCTPALPLPFANIANQKNSVNFYHMGMYAEPKLMEWYLAEFPKYIKLKPDMGKSCLRFKKIDQIPYQLIGELVAKMNVQEWIALYEEKFVKK